MNIANLRKNLMSQMYIVQAQLESIILLIEEIENEEDETCPHPNNMRTNLTVMGGPDHWICKLCGYEYIEAVKEKENLE